VKARIVLTACVLLAVTGCGGSEAASGAERSVVAAFYPLAWAAEQIGGETVSVTNLTPAGAEPHDVELSARDVERIREADLVLYLGQGFQPAVERAAVDADADAVDLLDGQSLDGTDPHVWLDPIRFARIARRVGAALGRPSEPLERDLRALDTRFRRGLADCERREIVTSHAAFGYLADRYGLEQIAITGLSPEAEPTPRKLERVIADVREHHATTVFFETLVSPRLAETVARETGARTAVLNPIEGLTDAQVAEGEDYVSLMGENLAALRQALGCR
jgi:zinc transport system substrate-binding protein